MFFDFNELNLVLNFNELKYDIYMAMANIYC